MAITPKNKLVRDLIPDTIVAEGRTPNTITLDPDRFVDELIKKLREEVAEITVAIPGSPEHLAEEISDLYEVIDSLIKIKDLDKKQISEIQTKKRQERGGFEKRIFLVSIKEKD